MKKVCASLLLMTILVGTASGCIRDTGRTAATTLRATDATTAPYAGTDAEWLSELERIVQSSSETVTNLQQMLDEQVRLARSQVEDYQAATAAGETFDGTPFVDMVTANKVAVAAADGRTRFMKQRLDTAGMPESEAARQIRTAAYVYFDRLQSYLDVLSGDLTFYLDQNEATAPMSEFDASLYDQDTLAAIESLYNVTDASIQNLRSVTSCPAHLQKTYDVYLDQIGVYSTMLESLYYGFAQDDVLRLTSANELYERQSVVVMDAEISLFELFNLQFEKLGERIRDSLTLLQQELLDNSAGLREGGETASVTFTYTSQEPVLDAEYEISDTIYPNLYPSMNSVINLTANVLNGELDVLVRAEIAGFTQVYEQKVRIGEPVTKMLIKPVSLASGIDLSRSRDAQLDFSITDADTGEVLVQESRTINLMSIYDFSLMDDNFGLVSKDNILAWLTPESDGILNLRREAISWLEDWTDGEISMLPGYQEYGVFEDITDNVRLQIVALQGAISQMGVRYNMGYYSLAEGANQRVLLPDDILDSRSGICIETAILMASAIQSTGMHPMIVFVPGHAQVAVETWAGSGEYFLVETTLLPFTAESDEIASLVRYLTAEEWAGYLDDPWGDGSGTGYVVDCDLINILGIKGLMY